MSKELRADDFRKAWPTALSTAMREVDELTDRLELVQESVERSSATAVEIAEVLPLIIKTFKSRTDEVVDKVNADIKQQGAIIIALVNVQAQMNETLESFQQASLVFTEKLSELDKSIKELKSSQMQSSKSLFQRIFGWR